MNDKEDLKLLCEHKYSMGGQVQYIRSDEDLQDVIVNIMQSLRILIVYMGKSAIRHKSSDFSFFKPLKRTISFLINHIAKINYFLANYKRYICVPAVCIVMESISVLVTKLVITTLKIFMEYDKNQLVFIIGLVTIFYKI